MSSIRRLIITSAFVSTFGSPLGQVTARAADPATAVALPYSTRTTPYSAYHAGTRGDIRTVGMAGATIGLGDTFAAAGDSPAGLALTLNVGDTHASGNQITDRDLQGSQNTVTSAGIGAALAPSDWAFSLGSINTWGEGQYFQIPGTNAPQHLDLYTREYRLGVARRWQDEGLAVGAQLRMGVLRQSLGTDPNEFSNPTQTTLALGLTAGVLYRLPDGFLIGAALNTPMNYEPGSSAASQPEYAALPSFFQAAQAPFRASLGLGYIPNRLFRADLTLHRVSSTEGATLLADQGKTVGAHTTFEPRIGVAYVFGDFRSMRATGFAGTYVESARIDGTQSRIHGTGGGELKWGFVNMGVGFDVAPRYQNIMASIGVDPFGVMEHVGLIPKPAPVKIRGVMPSPFFRSDEGLSPGLVKRKDRENGGDAGIDPVRIGLDLPRKLGEKVKSISAEGMIETLRGLPADIGKDLREVGDEIQKKLQK